jgi:hypothetical protein
VSETSTDAADAREGIGERRPGDRDRRVGVWMRAIAVFGVVVSVVVSASLWQFLGDLDRNLNQSLVIGEDAATTLRETIDVADEIVASLDTGLTTLGRTLETVDRAVADSSGVAASTATLASTLPDSFDDIDAALATVESLSGAIDGALRGASRIPLGPDYDPEVPLPTAVADLRAAFEPIGDDLAVIAGELEAFADGSDGLQRDIGDVRADLERTQTALADSSRLLDRYRVAADDARELAASSRSDLDRSLAWARLAVVLVGLLLAAMQFVPWWLGGRLLANRDASADPDGFGPVPR